MYFGGMHCCNCKGGWGLLWLTVRTAPVRFMLICNLRWSLQCHRLVYWPCLGDRKVHPLYVPGGNVWTNHVLRDPGRGHDPDPVYEHLSGARDERLSPRGGAVCQVGVFVPEPRDHDPLHPPSLLDTCQVGLTWMWLWHVPLLLDTSGWIDIDMTVAPAMAVWNMSRWLDDDMTCACHGCFMPVRLDSNWHPPMMAVLLLKHLTPSWSSKGFFITFHVPNSDWTLFAICPCGAFHSSTSATLFLS